MAQATESPASTRAAGSDPAELAHVVSSFNELVSRLQTTHEALKGEVARLQGELSEANRRLRRSQAARSGWTSRIATGGRCTTATASPVSPSIRTAGSRP